MRLKNYTDIPSDEIRAIIRAVCPPGVNGFDVRISNRTRGKGGRGSAYYAGSGYHDRPCPFIVVAIAKTEQSARVLGINSVKLGRGYLQFATGSRRELLVTIIAHELRHLWQSKVKRGRRVYGARGQFSERDADAYALQMLRRYRRGELPL